MIEKFMLFKVLFGLFPWQKIGIQWRTGPGQESSHVVPLRMWMQQFTVQSAVAISTSETL